MILDILKKEETLTVNIQGRLDSTTSPELEKKLKESLGGIRRIIFDCEKLEYLSSAGIRILLASSMQMKKISGSVTVKNLCDVVREVLEITGMIDILDVE